MVTAWGNPDAPFVLIQPVDGHDLMEMEAETAEIRKRVKEDFSLIALRVRHWNDDLSPWPAPAVFGKEGFGGRAAETLQTILPLTADKTKTYILGGYSLAGLFALWAACRTDAFAAVAAASPSVWFPGFVEDLKKNGIRARKVYLSLGDREEKARNPVMAAVGDGIRAACDALREQGIDVTLEWNPGNHFRDAALRTAKAFAWAMRR